MPPESGVPVEVKIDGDAINDQIVKAITDSVLGEQLRKEVERQIKGLHGYDGPVRKTVENIIRSHVGDIIQSEHADKIKQQVAEQITPELIDDLFKKLWHNFRP